MHLPKPLELTTLRATPDVNSALWGVVTCQCGFLSCTKCTTLLGEIGNGGGDVCVGTGGRWEISVPSW